MRSGGIARIAALAVPVAVALGAAIAGAATEGGPSGTPVDDVGPSARIERQLTEAGEVGLTDEYPPPNVTATGWLVYDALTDEPIAGVEATTPRPIASLAKLMTALVVVERIEPDELVTIPPSVNDLGADASRMDAARARSGPPATCCARC